MAMSSAGTNLHLFSMDFGRSEPRRWSLS